MRLSVVSFYMLLIQLMDSSSSLPPSRRCSSLFSPNIAKPELLPAPANQDQKKPFDSTLDNSSHRRTHSDILNLLNEISFDSDVDVVGGLDGLNKASEGSASAVEELPTSGMKPRIRLHHSQSSLSVTSMKTDMLEPGSDSPSQDESKAPMSAANLAELALSDPKRAKRIWANRKSAARSKERKMSYINELQSKVQTMQTEKTSLSLQLNLFQRETTGLASENIELKLHLQNIEQQVHVQDALNDALKEEIQHLKVLTGQAVPNGPPFGANQQFHSNNRAAPPLQYQFRQHQLDQFQPRQLLLH